MPYNFNDVTAHCSGYALVTGARSRPTVSHNGVTSSRQPTIPQTSFNDSAIQSVE